MSNIVNNTTMDTGIKPPTIRSRSSTIDSNYDTQYNNSLLSNSNSIYISQKELRTSMDTFKNLLACTMEFEHKIQNFSKASSDFASQIENLARLKGVDEEADGLQSISGLHFVMATHIELLSQALNQSVILPLEKSLLSFEEKLKTEENERQKTLAYISHKIKVTEARSLETAKRGTRDLTQFRNILTELTNQVDEMERVNQEHYIKKYEWQRENGLFIKQCLNSFVKVEIELFDRIISKCIQDDYLKKIITEEPEPFSIYDRVDKNKEELFTVLPTTPIFEQQSLHHLSNTIAYHSFIPNSFNNNNNNNNTDDTNENDNNNNNIAPPLTPTININSISTNSQSNSMDIVNLLNSEEETTNIQNHETINRSTKTEVEKISKQNNNSNHNYKEYEFKSSSPLMSDHSNDYYYDNNGNLRDITPLISPLPMSEYNPTPLSKNVDYSYYNELNGNNNNEESNSNKNDNEKESMNEIYELHRNDSIVTMDSVQSFNSSNVSVNSNSKMEDDEQNGQENIQTKNKEKGKKKDSLYNQVIKQNFRESNTALKGAE
ncbi:hypothetical protein K502DRAFT_362288 [Neoconidiobolus thromboides FSU 785]|nr:hypothetical protein K502DRAFT_362288 [Neoconidiobolus thromboides FSU 785]